MPASSGADRGTQIALMLAYQDRVASGRSLPSFHEIEFRNNAQNGEDGILLFIFALAGMGSRRAAEICAGNGIECNSANLVLHHGWSALLVDGNPDLVEAGKAFYAGHPETFRIGPLLEHTWVTRDNAQEVLQRAGYDEGLDLLSIDMDGNDYWVMKSLEVRPRVIVCEYNNRIPPGEALTIPYDEEFAAEGSLFRGNGFFGASLGAFRGLLSSRGYRLVGANRPNTNAFFLRDDVLPDLLPEVDEASCLSSAWAQSMCAKWWPQLQSQPWVRV